MQTKIDGLPAGSAGSVCVGSTWRWTGRAVCLGRSVDVASAPDLSNPEVIRRQTAKAVNHLAGRALSTGMLRDAALFDTPVHDRGFVVSDGRRRYTATLLELPELARPMLLFVGYMPPANTDLWVIEARIDNETFHRQTETPTGVICFTQGTRLDTPDGPRAVESLREGDYVLTKDDGPQEVLWQGHRRMSGARLHAMPELRPIRFREGALGDDRPSGDLIVSPRHKMLLKGAVARALFDTSEVFVAAQDLVNDRSILVDHSLREVTYVHLMLPRHQVVWANGVETESFHPASTALETIDPDQRVRLASLLPDIETDPATYGEAARRQLTSQEAALLSLEAFAQH